MPKVLTAARVRVAAQNETEYVNTLRELSQFAEARGQRIWLFRNAKDPQLFTESSKSPTGRPNRPQSSRPPGEPRLRSRRQAPGPYAPAPGGRGPRGRSARPPEARGGPGPA